MARTQRFFQSGLIIILVLLVVVAGYYFIRRFAGPGLDPMTAVPKGTGIVIKINQPGRLLESLEQGNEIWSGLLETSDPGSALANLRKADSLISAWGYDEFLEKGSIYLAVASDSSGTSTSVIFNWPSGASTDDLEKIIGLFSGRALQRAKKDLIGLRGYQLSDSAGTYCYYATGRGLCLISRKIAMLEASATRISKGWSLPESGLFEKVSATSGHNVDANIYVNFNAVPDLAKKFFVPSYHGDGKLLPDFGSWSEVDLLVKNDELLLNGYTETVDTGQQFLSLFEKQAPQKIEVTRILPYTTSLLLSFGISDMEDFYRDYGAYLDNPGVFPERNEKLDNLIRRAGPNLQEYMTSWIGNEIALAVINPHLEDPFNNTFMVIHAADIESAISKLGSLAASSGSYAYRDYQIGHIPIRDLLPVVFGSVFSPIRENYYARVEDYIVFANSGRSLENLINIFLSGKTLEQNENFKGFTDNVADASNLFCYYNIRNSASELEKILSEPLAGFVRNNPGIVSNFEALAVQFKALNKMYFTSVYVRYNKDYVKEDLSIWKAYLDAPVYGQPYFVKDHRTNNLKIVAFDTLNNMYLIDHDGNIEWKLNIGEKVISDVHTVDYYRNGKIQYLFNTENRIYLIDLLGRDVEGYPVTLREKATNGLAVFDYDNKRDYRIMLACDDNRVYNFDIQGKKIGGWKNPMAKGRITKPVQHLRDHGKDYIIIADEEGNIRITDRRGRDRINLKTPFLNAAHSEFYVNETNSKGIFLTTDREGELVYIKDNGRIETTDFGTFSKDHYFLYEDFDNRGGKDFIYLDRSKLTVYDRFKNVMFTHTFENEIHSMPVIIPVSSREKLIGIVSKESGKIYLFDREGNLLSTPDHIGKTRMLVGSLKRDGQLNMIVGSGNTIYNYYFR